MIYNIKLLYSPVKWMSALIFVILIPIAVYAPTYYDFTNICSLYMPFIAILLFTEISLVDNDNLIVAGTSIFLGSLSMSISRIFKNIYVGYGVSLIYWIYWNINNESLSKFNLFPFLASPINYEKTMIFQWGLILGILVLECILKNNRYRICSIR